MRNDRGSEVSRVGPVEASRCEVDVEVQYLRGSLVLRGGGEGSSPPRKLRAVKWNCRPDITLARVKEEMKFVRV